MPCRGHARRSLPGLPGHTSGGPRPHSPVSAAPAPLPDRPCRCWGAPTLPLPKPWARAGPHPARAARPCRTSGSAPPARAPGRWGSQSPRRWMRLPPKGRVRARVILTPLGNLSKRRWTRLPPAGAPPVKAERRGIATRQLGPTPCASAGQGVRECAAVHPTQLCTRTAAGADIYDVMLAAACCTSPPPMATLPFCWMYRWTCACQDRRRGARGGPLGWQRPC